jgi:nitrile hydratase
MAAGEHHDHGDGEVHEHPGMEGDVELSGRARRLLAMEELLVEKGTIGREDVRRLLDVVEARSPVDGARVVARAWTDPDYKRRLLEDGSKAIAEFGYSGVQGEDMVVIENTDDVHNLVTCTLCSCYPWPTLGLPPIWYKSAPFRARSVIDPRGVIEEFGVELSGDIEVRVWDSSAELRYLVLPQRPAGTEGMSEDELAALVTRDSMIGTALVEAPTG